MGDPMPLHGALGLIQWQYAVAATVTNYVVLYDRETRAWTLRGTLAGADPFKLKQRPLVFLTRASQGHALRWDVVDLELGAGQLRARVLPA